MLVSINKAWCNHVPFSIDGVFSRNVHLCDDGYFAIFDPNISDSVKVGFRVHDASVKDNYVKLLIGIWAFFSCCFIAATRKKCGNK